MLTREEKIAELRRQDKIAQLRAMDEVETLPERSTGEYLRDIGTAATQGATWKWGDELTSAAAATIGSVFGDDDLSWGERYEDILGAENRRFDQYTQERPGEALGFEIAGGLLTRRPRPKQIADKVLGRTAKVAQKRAIAAAEQTGSGRVRQNLLKNTLGGAAEGAAAGMGANYEDRAAGGITGAVLGAALPLALNVPGQVARTVGRRRVATELGKGDEFIPLHMATDKKASWIGELQRDITGKSQFTRSALADQERKYLDRQAAKIAERKLKVDDMADAISSERAANKVLKKTDELTAQKAGEQANAALRRMAADEALPRNAGAKVREKLAQDDPFQARKRLDNWWRQNGFDMVKKREFAWDGGLTDDLTDLVRNDPDLALALGPVFKKVPALAQKIQKLSTGGGDGITSPEVAKALDQLFANPTGISGDALMAIRNVFARQANSSTGFNSGAMRQVANQIDEMIRRQLGDGADAFDDHLSRWAVKENFGRSVKDATKKKQGRFGADEWIGKEGHFKYGEGPLQREAMDAQTTAARAKASIAERAEARARKVAGMGDEKRVLSRALGAQREEAASVANRAIQETVPIHQRAAATGIMGTAGLATLGLAPWMALSAGGQRTLAGQAGWQKAGQAGYRKWMEQERLRKLADRLRTSGSRYIAGDQ